MGPHEASAFDASICPVTTACAWCGAEILFGPATTYIEAELRACSRCPPGVADRAALLEGVAVGIRAAAGDDDAALLCPPHPFGSDAWHLWKRGWWAGFFAADDDPGRRAARMGLSVGTGEWRPSGARSAA
jgi:hypothetical protein